jgi:heptosyltransferase-2
MTQPSQSPRIGRAKAATARPVVAPERILIVAPVGVGDMILAEPLTRLLRRLYPKAVIDMLAPPETAALVPFMPEVRAVLTTSYAPGDLAVFARWRLSRRVRGENYDLAILLPNSVKSALVPFLAGIPKRVGYAREGRALLLTEARWLDRTRLHRRIDRFLALALPETTPRPFGAPAPALLVPDDAIDQALESLGLERPAGKLLLLVPGADEAPAARWPAEHFATLAKHHHAAGGSVWLLGSTGTREATAAVQAISGGVCLDFAGRTSPTEAAALIALADAVASNDTGLAQVAAALGHRSLVELTPQQAIDALSAQERRR